jgi:surface antigen
LPITRLELGLDLLLSLVFGAKVINMASRSRPIFQRLEFWGRAGKTGLSVVRILAPLIFLAPALAGCSVSFPISPLLWPGTNADSAGEVLPQPFAGMLDSGDWRLAKAALSSALDPKGNDAPSSWMNPESGNKGSFAPLGRAYFSDSKTCRLFLANIERKDGGGALEGTACRENQGEWAIAEAKPWKKV